MYLRTKVENLGTFLVKFGDIFSEIQKQKSFFVFEDKSREFGDTFSEIWGQKKIFIFEDKSREFGDIFSEIWGHFKWDPNINRAHQAD